MFYGFQDGQSRDRNGQSKYGPRIAFATWHRNRYLLNSGCCHIKSSVSHGAIIPHLGRDSSSINPAKHQPYKAVSPGVSYDLFLTSLCLFEHEPGVVTSLKAVILQKWQSLSGANEMEGIMPLFYRSATIGRSYRKRLHAEIAQIDLNTSADASRTKAFSKGVGGRPPSTPTAIHCSGYSHVQQVSAHLKGYWRLDFAPLQWQRPAISPGIKPAQRTEYSHRSSIKSKKMTLRLLLRLSRPIRLASTERFWPHRDRISNGSI